VDPSAVLRTLVYSLLTGKAIRSLNPQNDVGRVKGGPPGGCHLGPRPARARGAVTIPPNRPSSAPSATITPSRLITIPPNPVSLAECGPMLCWPGCGTSRQRRAPGALLSEPDAGQESAEGGAVGGVVDWRAHRPKFVHPAHAAEWLD